MELSPSVGQAGTAAAIEIASRTEAGASDTPPKFTSSGIGPLSESAMSQLCVRVSSSSAASFTSSVSCVQSGMGVPTTVDRYRDEGVHHHLRSGALDDPGDLAGLEFDR